jgi:F1F0 ATPase subunit 2
MTLGLLSIALYLTIGLCAGILYFTGLWWTVLRLTRTRRPAVWSLASFLSRAAVVLTLFYVSTHGRWDRLLICLAGFTIARFLLLRRLRPRKAGTGVFEAPVEGIPRLPDG